jgi:RNA polymerase sigma factor (TIGR02999 family)
VLSFNPITVLRPFDRTFRGIKFVLKKEIVDETAFLHEFFASHYEDLRQIAHGRLRRNEKLTLLDTTALVHESYLRLLKAKHIEIGGQSQFLAFAARIMRSIIVDFVRSRRAERRGGDEVRVTLGPEIAQSRAPADEILRVNDALDELAKVDGRLVQVVEMRYFGGLEEREIAGILGVTDRTVRRDWEKARMLLLLALE